jgi:hypothetical protein
MLNASVDWYNGYNSLTMNYYHKPANLTNEIMNKLTNEILYHNRTLAVTEAYA